MTHTSRARVLAAVRTALLDIAAADKAPPAAAASPVSAPAVSPIRSFVAGAQEAGAVVTLACGAADAAERVAEIFLEQQVHSAVVSPSASGLLPLARWTGRALVRATLERDVLFAVDAGVTRASFGLADTGALVLESSAIEHRLDSLVPPIHIALLDASCILPDLEALFPALAARGSFAEHSAITFVRGPSRTADVELTLSIGVHGPRCLYILVVE
jgi:L-lactate dehydrogenase complex protein LldG